MANHIETSLINVVRPLRLWRGGLTYPDHEELSRLLSVKEVAQRLGVSREVVEARIEGGSLGAVNLGMVGGKRMLRVSEESLEAYIESRRVRTSAVHTTHAVRRRQCLPPGILQLA